MPARPRLNEQLRFVLRFGAIAGTLLLIYCFPYQENGLSEAWFQDFLAGYAKLAAGLIRLFDETAIVSGTEIQGRFAVRVVKSCDAMEVKILFSSAVLAFPAPWKHRLVGVLGGLAALTTINLVRITSLYLVGIWLPSAIDVLHLEVWPIVMLLVATAMFLAYTVFLNRSGVSETAPSA